MIFSYVLFNIFPSVYFLGGIKNIFVDLCGITVEELRSRSDYCLAIRTFTLRCSAAFAQHVVIAWS